MIEKIKRFVFDDEKSDGRTVSVGLEYIFEFALVFMFAFIVGIVGNDSEQLRFVVRVVLSFWVVSVLYRLMLTKNFAIVLLVAYVLIDITRLLL